MVAPGLSFTPWTQLYIEGIHYVTVRCWSSVEDLPRWRVQVGLLPSAEARALGSLVNLSDGGEACGGGGHGFVPAGDRKAVGKGQVDLGGGAQAPGANSSLIAGWLPAGSLSRRAVAAARRSLVGRARRPRPRLLTTAGRVPPRRPAALEPVWVDTTTHAQRRREGLSGANEARARVAHAQAPFTAVACAERGTTSEGAGQAPEAVVGVSETR